MSSLERDGPPVRAVTFGEDLSWAEDREGNYGLYDIPAGARAEER